MVKATIVIFGGTGDLVKLKLVPAFAELSHDGFLEKGSIVCGIARGDFTNESYRDLLHASVRNEKEHAGLDKLDIKFFRKDSSVDGALAELPAFLQSGNELTLFYFSVSYKLFVPIIANLSKAGLLTGNVRIVLEKPIGESYDSYLAMEQEFTKYASEELIYRIDHYLAKETVQNIHTLKFTNPMIEHSFTPSQIECIEIISHETLGVGTRLGFYEGVGATKDMIQSHLLQVLATVMMNRPATFSSDEISNQKAAVLSGLQIADVKFGQYASYVNELGKESMTDTFCRVVFLHKDWPGTTIVVETGKKLAQKLGQIKIVYRRNQLEHHNNELIIDTHPSEDVKLIMQTRKRGSLDVVPIALHFSHIDHFGPNTTDGYKKLMYDALLGEKQLFARDDEIRLCWKLTDEILARKQTLIRYPDGTYPQ